jgi:hypothetical protein
MNRARMIPGLILIVIGIALLLMQFFRFGPGQFLLLLGLIFLVPYFLTRGYGLLIPGCILAGMGLGLIFETSEEMSVTFPIGLGLGFIAIFVIQLLVAGHSHWWPLVPGVALVLTGLAESLPQAQTLFEKGWPLLLILIGLAILLGQFWRSKPGSHMSIW